jgi:Ca2+/Na+ antiporter
MTVNYLVLAGIVLFALAIGAGAAGTYHNVRNARGPKERSLVARVALVSWLVIFSMLACAYLLHPPVLYVVMAAYFIICPILVYRWANKHQLVRWIEQRENGHTG